MKNSKATVITLSGELGAGKTHFTKYLAKSLGVKEIVNSPTYVIIKNYKLKSKHYDKLVHIDAYRLAGADDLVRLGWYEILVNPRNLVVIEWPEIVRGVIPTNAIKLTIKGAII